MTADVAVISAIYDGYDTIKPILEQDGAGTVEWIMVTDSDILAAEAGADDVHPTGWTIVHTPLPEMHPNRAAKYPKMLPTNYTDAPASVWLDASFQVVDRRFVADVLTTAVVSPNGITQFAHPWRACAYEEAAISAGMAKYLGEPIMRQAEAYRTMGMPPRFGLWATGLIARHHSAKLDLWGARWLDEIEKWSFQDQISHPFACWAAGVRPANLPGDHFRNPWVIYKGSARHG